MCVWIWDGMEEGGFFIKCVVDVPRAGSECVGRIFFLYFLSSSSVFVDWERIYFTGWMRDLLDLSFSLLFFTSSAIDFSPFLPPTFILFFCALLLLPRRS